MANNFSGPVTVNPNVAPAAGLYTGTPAVNAAAGQPSSYSATAQRYANQAGQYLQQQGQDVQNYVAKYLPQSQKAHARWWTWLAALLGLVLLGLLIWGIVEAIKAAQRNSAPFTGYTCAADGTAIPAHCVPGTDAGCYATADECLA